MLYSMSIFEVVFTIIYLLCLISYFLNQEYLNANKMFGHSRAVKFLLQKLLPFGTIVIVGLSISLLFFFCLPDKAPLAYLYIFFNLSFSFWFLRIFLDFLSSKISSQTKIFVYVNRQERERYLALFAGCLSASTCMIVFVLRENSFISISTVLILGLFLCFGTHNLILSFNSLKILEEGIIYKFRLIRWDRILAYKNSSELLDRYRNKLTESEIIFCIKSKLGCRSQFIKIPIASQSMNSITQILVEKLPEKNI